MKFKNVEIDRTSPVPAYYQIAMDMKERISRGEWGLDQRLPTETDLAEQYQVCRITLRQAMAELEKDGLVIKKRGRGTFIHAEPKAHITKLNYLLTSDDQATPENSSLVSTVLEKRIVTDLFTAVHKSLQLKPEDEAVYIKRLYLRDGKPIAITRSHIPAYMVPGLDEIALLNGSLSSTLKKVYNLKPVRVDDSIEAVRATQAECALLQCSNDSPIILIEGTSYLEDGRPLEYSCTLWAGDSVRFSLPLLLTGEK